MVKKSVITRVVMATLVVVSVIGYHTVASKGSEAVEYNFDYGSYGEVHCNVSRFATKETNSSIEVLNSSSTDSYYVYALGAYDTGNVDNYSDASGGNQYWFNGSNMERAELTNYVNEWGYSTAGIKGIFQGDALFYAHGFFWTDQ